MIVFDIDGTLTDTTGVDDRCYLDAASAVLGEAMEDVDWNTFPHVTDAGITRHLTRSRSPETRDLLTQRIEANFLERLRAAAQQSPESFHEISGAGVMLESLTRRAIPFALATGAWRASAEIKLAAAGLPNENLRATSSEFVARVDIFRAAADGAAPNILIGDGAWDARTADALGSRFIGIGTGPRAELLKSLGAERVMADYRELEPFLGLLR